MGRVGLGRGVRDLWGAWITGAPGSTGCRSMGRTSMGCADLWGARMYGVRIHGGHRSVGRRDLWGTDVWGTDLWGAGIYGALIYGARIYGARRPVAVPTRVFAVGCMRCPLGGQSRGAAPWPLGVVGLGL